ncbi:hypothetical protein ACJMK2_000600 [Sinanodonta woodiana]|uniref:Solute carrier organic anion transporter family member n=1 Tax=Sinanodonta woodiana TaxID=1069815 RepID=A0ABD3XRI8_SINWO
MSGPVVSTGNPPLKDSNEIDMSTISNNKLGNESMVESLEDKQKEDTEVEQNSRNCFKSLLSFSIVFGTGSMLSHTVSTYLSSQITTIEKVFGLSSSKSGMLLSANDIGFLTTVLFASHFLHRYHIPRILAVSILIVGVFAIVVAIPKLFLSDAPAVDKPETINSTHNSTANLCVLYNISEHLTRTDSTCTSDAKKENEAPGSSGGNIWFLVLMGFALIIVGMAKAPRQALQTIYVDNNTDRSKAGFYIGILSTFGIFGPFSALVLGGLFNKIPTDLKETSLTPTDPRWIGAWWLGFIVFGSGCILSSLVLFCFPRGKGVSSERNEKDPAKQNQSFFKNLKDLPRSIWRLLKDPVYSLSCINAVATSFGSMALSSFGPKYMETQFFLPTWKADMILGAEKLATTTVGTMVGGLISRRMRLSRTGCLKLLFYTRLAHTILTGFNYMLGCDHSHMYGMDTSRGGNDSFPCDCSNVNYLPVCLDGSKTYFSPCHAGCEEKAGGGFTKCSLSETGQVTSGICDNSCNFLIPFIIVNSVGTLIASVGLAPSMLVYLSSAQDRDRSLAIGLHSFLLSILVFLPAHLVYGKIFDTACLIWHTTCGKEGACSYYDSQGMRTKLISVDFGLKVIAFISTSFALIFSLRKDKTVDVYEMKIDISKDIEATQFTKLSERL